MTFAPFVTFVTLFDFFLTRRRDSVERIEQQLLNVQGKETSRRRDRAYFENLLDSCFFGLPGLPAGSARFKGQLAASHRADGFEPIPLDRFAHELDPLELILRAYHHWEHHRWPGRSGRLTYAQTIYSVFMLRQLEGLSLRIWDDGPDPTPDRLGEIQRLLDRLNAPPSPDVFIRDARWLILTAQGPLTRSLAPYFKVAAQIGESFTGAAGLEIHKAGAKLTGGHLRSQLRYRTWETGQPVDHPDVLSVTRNSNSMDVALLVGDLELLLKAYAAASDTDERLELADAILQGLSSDPELLVTRLDLLGPLTWIEDLPVVTTDRHAQLIDRYSQLIGRLAPKLREDAAIFDPSRNVYSPLGIVYGFVADALSNMAHSRLLGDSSDLTLEDIFISRGRLDDKLALANRWTKLPTKPGEREHFEHSLDWAGVMFQQLTNALDARARHPDNPNASAIRSARLILLPESTSNDPASAPAQEFLVTSDVAHASTTAATLLPRSQILSDRQEGRFLASCELNSHWFGISKVMLTVHTSHGRDAVIAHVPPALSALVARLGL